MGFYNGSSTGPNDLIDKFRLAALAEGWTVNLYEEDNSSYETWEGLIGTGRRLHIQKTASDDTVMYFNLRSVVRGIVFSEYYPDSNAKVNGLYYSEMTGLAMYGSTGFDAEESWDLQPGGTINDSDESWGMVITGISISAIPSYYFSFFEDTVTICVEYTSGKFQWLCFALLDKKGAGDYPGGQFFTGSINSWEPSLYLFSVVYLDFPFISFFSSDVGIPKGAVYLEYDGIAGWRVSGKHALWGENSLYSCIRFPSFNPSIINPNYYNWFSLLNFWTTRSPNTFNNLPPFARLYITCRRADGRYSYIGCPAGIRLVAPKNYNAGEQIVYGDDTWIILPAHSKLDPQGDRVGYALLKNE